MHSHINLREVNRNSFYASVIRNGDITVLAKFPCSHTVSQQDKLTFTSLGLDLSVLSPFGHYILLYLTSYPRRRHCVISS